MKRLISGITKVDIFLYIMAGGALVAMILVTLADVILRNFGYPITGSMEIIQYGGSIVFGFSLPYATCLKAQVYVDLILEKINPGKKKVITIVTRITGILLFLFIAYNFFLYGMDVKSTGEVTACFRIPYYPFVFALSFSFFFQGLTIFCDLVQTIQGKNNE